MKIIYALRRGVFYPHQEDIFGQLPPKKLRPSFLKLVRGMGFEGIELGVDAFQDNNVKCRELAKELASAGVPCVALRAGGGFAHPRAAAESTRRLDRAIEIAAIVGATVVNSALVTPVTDPKGPGIFVGEPVSQGSSRLASEEDFIRTASALQKAGKLAMDKGLDISIEVHQRSIADNGWSANHLLELINRPNVGVNPDLGNVYWTYEEPEETCEAAISALAPLSNYWHCKNLVRVHIPENNHSIFLQTALPDGDIDYRFAISAMLDAGYKGYLALEGTRKGDTLSKDDRSVAYVNGLLKKLGAGK